MNTNFTNLTNYYWRFNSCQSVKFVFEKNYGKTEDDKFRVFRVFRC